MLDKGELKTQIQAITDMQTTPEAHDATPTTIEKILQDLTPDEKRELLRWWYAHHE